MATTNDIKAAMDALSTANANFLNAKVSELTSFLTAIEAAASNVDLPYLDDPRTTFNPSEIVIDEPFPQAPNLEAENAPGTPSINIPQFTETLSIEGIDYPSETFNYTEAQYVYYLIDTLKQRLGDAAYGMITGFDANTEQDMIDRQSERDEKIYQDTVNKTRAEWSKAGWTLPNGILLAAIQDLTQKFSDTKTDRSRDIRIEQAKYTFEFTKFGISSALQAEGLLMQHYDNMARRALMAAEAVVNMAIALYNSKVESIKIKLEKYKTQAAVYETLMRATTAQLDIFKSQIDAYISKIRASVEIYKTKVDGFNAKVGLQTANANIKIKQQDMIMKNVETSLQMSIQRAATNLNAFLELAKIRLNTQEKNALIHASMVTAALQSMNGITQLAGTVQSTEQ